MEATAMNVSDLVGSKSWQRKVRSEAKKLVQELDTGYMRLAELLYKVYTTPVDGDPERIGVYKEWGYESFGEYAEKELGISSRKAYYLNKIWYTIEVELELDDDLKRRFTAIGWSKAREIVRVMNNANAEKWISLAEDLNFTELDAAIKKYVDESGGSYQEARENVEVEPVPTKVNFERFALVDEQHENVKQALEAASKLSGSDVKSHNLDLICTDFLANNDFARDEQANREAYLAKAEALLNVKIIAVDALSGDLVYGAETLRELAADEDSSA